jgi:hypothetical protein
MGFFCLNKRKETKMHIYWRVQQDLNCLGEVIQFHDPSFIRSQRQWIQRNASGIALAESICTNIENINDIPMTAHGIKIGSLNLPDYSRN